MKMWASTYSSNVIIKVEKLVKYMAPKSLTFDDCVIIPSLKSHFSCRDLNTINYVFESLIFNLLVIIHLLISARQLFNFEIASNGCLHLNYIYIYIYIYIHLNYIYIYIYTFKLYIYIYIYIYI